MKTKIANIQKKDLLHDPLIIDVPEFVNTVILRLNEAGYSAYVVGGAIRDIYLKRPVTDWDITTEASPEKIRLIFQDIHSFSLKHGTVTLIDSGIHYEVTHYKTADSCKSSIDIDLGHRDFTINAIAYDIQQKKILDPYNGLEDLREKRIQAVNDSEKRFMEDPLRLLRAIRFAIELGFTVEPKTLETISKMAKDLSAVAMERVREEFMKILLSKKPSRGIGLLNKTGLLNQIMPELLEGYRKKQNRYHRYTIYRHILEVVDYVEPNPILRLSALFHDIAKPRVRKKIDGMFRFYGHDEASAQLAKKVMERLKFSGETIKRVTHLISHHMVGYDGTWNDGTVRRWVLRVGSDVELQIALRRADLSARGFIDSKIDYLNELEKRVEALKQKSFAENITNLAIGGAEVMKILNLKSGPDVGVVLNQLYEIVTDKPELNTRKTLSNILHKMKQEKY